MSSFLRTLRVASQSRRLALRNATQLTVRPILRSSVYANFPSFPVHTFHSAAIAPARAGDPMHGIDPNHPFVQKLRDNPHIVQQLADFTVLLQEKGLDMSSGKQPGFGQVGGPPTPLFQFAPCTNCLLLAFVLLGMADNEAHV